jgi:hypothetical protein
MTRLSPDSLSGDTHLAGPGVGRGQLRREYPRRGPSDGRLGRAGRGVPGFLEGLRGALKAGTFRPLPVRERKIPKPGGSGKVRRRVGIL